MKRLISDTNGIKTFMELDGDKTHITKFQDVEDRLVLNKAMSNENGKQIRSDAYNHVASIPPIIINKWLQEGLNIYNPDHAAALKKKLNDPEWRYLRTSELNL